MLFFAFFTFLHYFLRQMWYEVLYECRAQDCPRLFKIISCGLVTMEDFRRSDTKHEEGSDLYQSD